MNASHVSRDFVLLVDDDDEILEEMGDALERNGVSCKICRNWDDMNKMLRVTKPSLIILDQYLGAFDTLLHVPTIRDITSAPILFFTGSRNEADRVIGLELGADNFLVKPMGSRELVARVRAHLRRPKIASGEAPKNEWRIVESESRVYRPDGTWVQLSVAEFKLLQMLAANPGVVIDRDKLCRHVMNRNYQEGDRSIDILVAFIRKKFNARNHKGLIISIRGIGYMFSSFLTL